MPAIKQIILTDGSNNLTLSPVGGQSANGSTKYRTTDGATQESNSELSFRSYMQGNNVQRQVVTLVKPITYVDADTGLTHVLDRAVGEISVRMPPGATPAFRAELVKQLLDADASAAFETELLSGEGQW